MAGLIGICCKSGLGDGLKEIKPPSSSLETILGNLPPQWTSLPTSEAINFPKGIQAGFVQTPEGLLLLTERPQISDREQLRLLIGQWLTPSRLKSFGERSLLRLRLLSIKDPEVPEELKSPQLGNLRSIKDYTPKPDLQPKLDGTAGKNIFPSEETKFQAGYILLRDIKGEPIAVLQSISPKPFATQGEEGVKILLLFVWLTVLVFGITSNLLLDRWVLSRISHLSKQLKEVKADFSHSTEVSLAGNDELSELASDINLMLQEQERYQESLRLAKAEIEAANQELERLACTDGLTKVMNRRFFQMHLDKIWQAALQSSQPLSLLLCDVDFFKLYNDTYGHLAGDLCLQKVAKAMADVVEREPNAIIARYGGEEFAAVLFNMPVSKAVDIAEQIRISVFNLNLPHASSKASDLVTLSIGVCSLIPQEHLSDRDLIAQADEYLYQAKSEGRNRVATNLANINKLPALS
ncbi:sensor domain-containing diguanylate cyclase [Pseudanabaena yagii]|uniref:Diguanylate cyclase n=1 Tax=Pseudanabaena yagii GIHE-NHR1 TaxID=2722753 RepID=A0ABX1LWB8_9CYAN|nr:diguanylate cyclase [Pseudanabaena yagii]NMF60454.1 diguanylate cyclase [Pseudanabaena yagii GIHE-NHR1]